MSDEILRESIRTILDIAHNASARDFDPAEQMSGWSLQGFGMLRLYLSSDVRLHVWSDADIAEGVSEIHDHPWDFTSHVISGVVQNTRYRVDFPRSNSPDPTVTDNPLMPWGRSKPTHWEEKIKCGPGGGALGDERLVVLVAQPVEVIKAGGTYSQRAYEVHDSAPSNGAVTVIHRSFHQDTEHARVFYPIGEKWGSAEPRPATAEEVHRIVGLALEVWSGRE
jgi:hypothetical protein